MKTLHAESLLGLSVTSIGCILLVSASSIGGEAGELPVAYSALLLGTGILLFLFGVRRGLKKPVEEAGGGETVKAKGMVLICLGIFAAASLLEIVGFYTTVGLLVYFVYLVYEDRLSAATLRRGAVFTLILMACLFIGFGLLMKIPTPSGLLI